MKLLAVDTSSNACSVALQTPDGITEKHVVEPRAHTRILMPMISELLSEGDAAPSDLDAIVLGNGPGSFVGMRIGASVVQGLCFAAGIRVIPISSLAAVAAEVFAEYDFSQVAVAQDARMNEAYVGRFKKDGSGMPVPIEEERIVAIRDLPTVVDDCAVAGAAWEKYPELLQANSQRVAPHVAVTVPRAKYLLLLGAVSDAAGESISPDQLSPAYLRHKVADIPTGGSNQRI